MPNLARYDFLVAVVVGFAGLALLGMRARKRRLPYPPGPKGLPVVGNLFGMPPKGSQEWITYRKWSEELGSDILHINQLGSHLIILNSAKAANDLLDKHSSVYSDRPPLVVMQDLFKLDFNFGAAPYGPVWRHSRREFQANLGPATLDAYRPLEQQAAHRLLRNLLSSPENFMQHIRHMAGQVIFSIAYGIDVLPENDPYVADAERVMRAAALATTMEARLLDLIPWLIKMPSWLPGARFKRYAREWRPIVAKGIHSPFEKVKSDLDAGTAPPSVAANLMTKLDDNSTEEDKWVAKAVPIGMYFGGADTTASALQTFILAMTLFPEAQRKAQAEIDQVVGSSRLPDFEDQDALPYVQAVLKEVLRWHPVIPLGSVHSAMVSDVYKGYYIPAGTIIIPNIWAMMHDPEVFPDPERFLPERWLSLDAPAFPTQAFGFGGRRCPGRYFARPSVWLNIVGILATFDISLTDEIPEQVYSSGVVSYVKPFRCNIKPRSATAASLVRATEIEV